MRHIILTLTLLACCVFSVTAWAETSTLTWLPNPELDLSGYRIFRANAPCLTATAPDPNVTPPIATVGNVATWTDAAIPATWTAVCYWVAAVDLAGNVSLLSAPAGKTLVPPVAAPGMPVLTVAARSASELTVSYPPVSDGTGGTAKVDVRYALAPALTNFGWGSAPSAPCPISPCLIPGLTAGTQYEVQAVASRMGTPNVFGSLSTVVSGTTWADVPPVQPKGLQVTKATADEVVIGASAVDCPRVVTSTSGSTSAIRKRTVRCVQ